MGRTSRPGVGHRTLPEMHAALSLALLFWAAFLGSANGQGFTLDTGGSVVGSGGGGTPSFGLAGGFNTGSSGSDASLTSSGSSLGGTLGSTFSSTPTETPAASGFSIGSTFSSTPTETPAASGFTIGTAGIDATTGNLVNNFASGSPPPPPAFDVSASPPPPADGELTTPTGDLTSTSGGFTLTGDASSGVTADPNLLNIPAATIPPMVDFNPAGTGSLDGTGQADPILGGFDGSTFSFMGQSGKYYNFITDTVQDEPQFQMSVRLKSALPGAEAALHTGTFIDGVGIHFRKGRFTMEANGKDGLNVTWNGKPLTMAADARDYEIYRVWRFPTGKMSMHWAKFRPGIGNSIVIKTDFLLFSFKLVPAEVLSDGTLSQPYINFNTSMVGSPAGTLSGVMGETYDVGLVSPDDDLRAATRARIRAQPHPFSSDDDYELPGFFDDLPGYMETRAQRSTLELPFFFGRKSPKPAATALPSTEEASAVEETSAFFDDDDVVPARAFAVPLAASAGVVTTLTAPPTPASFDVPLTASAGVATTLETPTREFSIPLVASAGVATSLADPAAFKPAVSSVRGAAEDAVAEADATVTWVTPEEAGAVDGEGEEGDTDLVERAVGEPVQETFAEVEKSHGPTWINRFLSAPLNLVKGAAAGVGHPCHGANWSVEEMDEMYDEDILSADEDDTQEVETRRGGVVPLTARLLGGAEAQALRATLVQAGASEQAVDAKVGSYRSPVDIQKEVEDMRTKLRTLQNVIFHLESSMKLMLASARP